MKKLLFLIAWLWVIVPLSWGVLKSVYKSKPLFFSPAGKPPVEQKVVK